MKRFVKINGKFVSWVLLFLVTAICSFFIVHNAGWILGDDAIVMSRSGWGHFFPLSATVKPEIGRFFPMSYFMYNFWAPLIGHKITAVQLYTYHAIIFVLFVISTFYLIQDILKKEKELYRYGTALLVVFFMIGRHLPEFVNCFSTSWFGAFLNVLLVLFAYLFYSRKKNFYGIIAFVTFVWTTYCSEVLFVVPLAWGVCGLLLWKESTKSERLFHISLIVSALIFLLVYFFFIYLKTDTFYSGSHGENIGLIENAIRIIIAQKFLWLVIILFVLRACDIIKNKSEFSIYDVLILTAAALCCGGFILKLNWVLYYNRAIVIALPSVIYYINYYLKPYWNLVIMSVFACWYGAKIPKTINNINSARFDTAQFMECVVSNMNNATDVYLYSPGEENDSFEGDQRRWVYDSFETFLAYYLDDEDLKIERIKHFEGEKGIYITIGYNDVLSKEGNELIVAGCDHIAHNNVRNIDAYIKE